MLNKRRLLAAALMSLFWTGAQAAEQDTVQGYIPWEAEGQVFQIDTNTMLFLGSLEGVLYVESSEGDMHEAFIMCPIIQTLDLTAGTTSATAHCELSAGPEDVLYARMSCEGELGGGGCSGKFTLVDGEGSFTGITGEGDLRVRSPMRMLITDMAAGATLRVGAGIAIIKDLQYRIP